MSRAISIHIGVNTPRGRMAGHPLRKCEAAAWRMAGLAERAGYEALLVLRGAAATRRAVHDALTAAAGSMTRDDILLVSFAGHGCLEEDHDGDDRHGWDETLCLYDGEVVDDQMAGYWRLFQPGVRIIFVVDGCHSGGVGRDEDEDEDEDEDLAPGAAASTADWVLPEEVPVYRSPDGLAAHAVRPAGACLEASPQAPDGIRASVLMLAAARENQKAQDGLFTHHLLKLWDGGAFPGTFDDLYWGVRDRVMTERSLRQEPQLRMLGSPDPGFRLERAFHLERGGAPDSTVFR